MWNHPVTVLKQWKKATQPQEPKEKRASPQWKLKEALAASEQEAHELALEVETLQKELGQRGNQFDDIDIANPPEGDPLRLATEEQAISVEEVKQLREQLAERDDLLEGIAERNEEDIAERIFRGLKAPEKIWRVIDLLTERLEAGAKEAKAA